MYNANLAEKICFFVILNELFKNDFRNCNPITEMMAEVNLF